MDACSFCGKAANECERLIVGGGGQAPGNARAVAICNECIELCNRMVHGPRVPMPSIPADVLRAAGTCPTDITEEPQSLVVNCACAFQPSEEEQVRRKQILAQYFPAGTRFRYFWPVEPPSEATAAEWLETLIEAPDETGPLTQRGG